MPLYLLRLRALQITMQLTVMQTIRTIQSTKCSWKKNSYAMPSSLTDADGRRLQSWPRPCTSSFIHVDSRVAAVVIEKMWSWTGIPLHCCTLSSRICALTWTRMSNYKLRATSAQQQNKFWLLGSSSITAIVNHNWICIGIRKPIPECEYVQITDCGWERGHEVHDDDFYDFVKCIRLIQ